MVSHFDTLDNYTSFPIPLEKLCSLEVRELVEQGTPEGSGHNHSAIKVLKDLIGVENYCQVNRIPYEGTARQYYESFLLASGIDSDSTTESRWKSAIAANPSPSLSPDKIQTCLNSWNRQHGQTGQQINLTRPQTPKKSKQSAKLPPIEGPVKLARFDVIPTDAPQATKPATLPKGVPDTATVKTYRYSQTQFVKRFDWEDKTKPKGRDKTFRQCHVNDEGDLTWGKGNDPWPAYRESEAIAVNGWPLFLEGEDCVETARRWGLVSGTFQGSNWSETAIAPALTRLKEAGCPGIAILPDNDETGEGKGQKVLSVAAKIGLPALIVPMVNLWPECPEKGDIADWEKWGQSMGMTQDDFIKRLEAEIQAAVNRRSQLSQESEPVADKPCSPVEQARVEIKQWLLENDPVAKALTRANLCRVLGVDRKTFDALAVSLDENGDKPKAKVYSPDEFMALPTGGSLLLAPGIAGNGVTIKAGPSGVGKTTLAYDLAGAVIMQDEFLGELPTRQGSVLFVSSDEPHAFAQDKLINRGITHGYKMMIDWDVSQWSDLEMTVEDMRPALVIVDSFNAIHNDPGFDENSAQASQTIKKLERLSVKYGVPIVLIHHTSKNKENRGVHKLRGSTAIAASCSSVLLLETIEGTTKALTQPKIRGSEPLNVIVEMDVESGRFKVTEGNVADNETKSLAQRLKDFFTVNPGFFEMTEIRDQFPGQDRKILTNSLNRLVNQGHIIKRPSKINPRFKVYGTERTSESESSPHTPLSHSYSCVKNDDSNPETIATQELEDVTIMSPSMSPSCHHHVTMKNDDNSVMTTETVENKGFEAPCHHVTIMSPLEGERVPTPNDDQGCVLGNENEDYPDFKQGDRVTYQRAGETVSATIKRIKTVSDKGASLSTPMAELDNGVTISTLWLKPIN